MRWRALTALLVVLLQLFVPVGYGMADYSDTPFKTADEIAANQQSAVGEEAVVYGQVVELDPVVIRAELDDGREVEYRTAGVDRQVDVGEYLEVYGVVETQQSILARGTVVRGEREHWYTYGVSFVAGLVVLGRIVRDWTVDLDRLALVPGGRDA
ncbi:hypothetical protein [Halomicrococcus gelatinilyticus]|uniref:hypothetical protein n=1 Tax=Halomicrococcus gelatinilyticus TaxID=1702103 RepID=UPI002E13EB69